MSLSLRMIPSGLLLSCELSRLKEVQLDEAEIEAEGSRRSRGQLCRDVRRLRAHILTLLIH